MNRVVINLEALEHNLRTIDRWMTAHQASWIVVSKVLCGNPDVLRALHALGVRSFGDSRLLNLQTIRQIAPQSNTWYLRPPHLSSTRTLVETAGTSLNSELRTIQELDREARNYGVMHEVVIMVELGDLREGVQPGALTRFYEGVLELRNIHVVGLGASLGCLAGAIPSVEQLNQLEMYRELLELKYRRRIPKVSAGSSVLLPLLREGVLPKAINHFRIGESLFLGTDLLTGKVLDGLRDDVITAEGEISEIKEKTLAPSGATSCMTPFASVGDAENALPGKRGYRALVTIGQLDTDVGGLVPVDPTHRIAGASSDITVVNLGEDPKGLDVGHSIRFRVNYAGLLRLMNDKYVPKEVVSGRAPAQSHARSRSTSRESETAQLFCEES
jgi:predicted amino acid racemase